MSGRKVILMYVMTKLVIKQASLLLGIAIAVGALIFCNFNRAFFKEGTT